MTDDLDIPPPPWVIVGCGRVGTALALFAAANGIEVVAAWDRDGPPVVPARHRLSGSLDTLANFVADAAVFITVSDTAIAAVAGALAPLLTEAAVVAHCSGSLPSTVLREAGIEVPVASVHPLLAVADPAEAVGRFGSAVWTVEGSSVGVWWARGWLGLIDVEPVAIQPDAKVLYHAAAVTSAGLIVALLDAAFEMGEAAGLGIVDMRRMLLPLAHSSLENLETLSPSEALTGPVARGDVDTVEEHQAAIDRLSPSTGQIYRALTERSRMLVSSTRRNHDD